MYTGVNRTAIGENRRNRTRGFYNGRTKRNRNADQTNDNADQTITASASADQTNETNAPTTSIEEFMQRPDRADWKTLIEAGAYLDMDADHLQPLRNAFKNRAEFKADGALLLVQMTGYKIPPFTYAHISALDAYKANQASGTNTRVRGGKRRQIVRLTAEEFAAYNAGTLALTADNFPLEVASTPKPKKPKPGDAAALDTSAPDNATNGDASANQTSDLFDPSYQQHGITTSADLK